MQNPSMNFVDSNLIWLLIANMSFYLDLIYWLNKNLI